MAMEINLDEILKEKFKAYISRSYVENDMVKVSSSNVDRISIVYNNEDKELCSFIVKYLNRDFVYIYVNVKVSDVEAFKEEESVGKAMNKYIKPYYDFIKMEINEE